MSYICIECRRVFAALGEAIKHVNPIVTMTYNDASPGKPKKIKTAHVEIPLRRYVFVDRRPNDTRAMVDGRIPWGAA